MKFLQRDFGALCTALLVATTLAVTAPFKVSFHSKLDTTLQSSASSISCSSVVCQVANRSGLTDTQETQAATDPAFSQSFTEIFSKPFSRQSSKEN
jgi:hypothetical protein